MLIDTHCHLQDEVLFEKIDDVILNSNKNNVKMLICSSYDLKSSEKADELTKIYPNVYATVGVHPENCEEYNLDVENEIIDLCKNKKIVAIGEIGLDYHYTKENKDIQKQTFISQIILADKLNLPIVIHTRDAIGDTMEIIREYKNYINNGGVFHCFNASKPVLDEIVKMGFCVSYGGAITFKNSTKLREIVQQTPINSILTETDCPYMAPEPLRGSVNEPKNIVYVAQKIAELKGIDFVELERIMQQNTMRIFKIDEGLWN